MERSRESWAKGTEFNYAILTADDEFAGSIGLMTRMGPGILEIGYWMGTAHAGRGYTTAAVRALTSVALTLPDAGRLVICHDVANAASAAVARKAGYVETARVARDPQAPGDTGTDVVRDYRP
ncbi:GNAT family N-acetyltransferase [Winogradskya humida]|uniref:GNAT family N-acetyltransferase n=1 Tax=Winogradskya humida TaxID=113566 RepID=UPI001EF2977E